MAGLRFPSSNVLLPIFLWWSSILISFEKIYAQNLLPNPSFEEYTECPDDYMHNDGPMKCPPWYALPTPDYFNSCNDWPVGVPVNSRGYQEAHDGVAYVGGYQNYPNIGTTEYIQAPLLETLEEGQCYLTSIWASLCNVSYRCGVNWISIKFLDHQGWPFLGGAHLDFNQNYFSDTTHWFQLSGTFIAAGWESHICIGSVHPDEETMLDPACQDDDIPSYYYFDNVRVEAVPTQSINVDLGGPYESCFPILLDPGIEGATYYWNNGTTNQTLLATESGTYTVVVTTGPCEGGVASVEVNILESNPVDIGPDTFLCDDETLLIELDPDVGDYEWQDGSTDPEYLITGPGIYSVEFTDQCFTTFDQIEITAIESPQFSLGADTLLCENETLHLWLSPGLGIFDWQDNSHHNQYFIDEAGTYALTVSNECGIWSDEVEVEYQLLPIVDIGPPSIVMCPGETFEIELDPEVGVYTWQNGSHDTSHEIEEAGTYIVTVTSYCGEAIDSIQATYLALPEISFDTDEYFLCPGESLILDASHVEGDYLWSTGSTEPFIEVTGPGNFTVQVSNECGSTEDVVVVDFAPDILPVSFGPDTVLCGIDSLLLSIQQPDANIEWQDNSSSDTYTVTTGGTYAVTISTICESFSDSIQIAFADGPPLILLPAIVTICDGLNFTLDPDISAATFSWNDGSTGDVLQISSPGIYSVTATNSCGMDSDTVVVISGGAGPFVNLGPDTIICPGEVFTLHPPHANVETWQWSDGTEHPFVTTTQPGQIIVEVSNSCGSMQDTMELNYQPALPVFELGTDTIICKGDTLQFTSSLSNVVFHWEDGSDEAHFMTSDSGYVSLQISDICDSLTDSLQISWYPAIPELNFTDTILWCPGEPYYLESGVQDVAHLWHDGTTNSNIEITGEGNIWLTISTICESTSDTTLVIETTQAPILELGADVVGCEGDTLQLFSGVSGVQYAWQDGSDQSFYEITQSGLYILTIRNACGMDSDSVYAWLEGYAPHTILGADTTICEGMTLLLTGSLSDDIEYMWQDGSTGEHFEVSTPGIYILTEFNNCGSDSDTIEIEVTGILPSLDLGPDTILCEGHSILLSVPSPAQSQHMWQDGSTHDTLEVTQSGMYILEQWNECGVNTDTIMVEFKFPPMPFTLGMDTTICEGASILLQGPKDINQAVWSNGATSASLLVSTADTYVLDVFNLCGLVSDTIQIDIDQSKPEHEIPELITICPDDTLLLDITQPFEAIYTWQNGEHDSMVTISTPGEYAFTIQTNCIESNWLVIVTEDSGCFPFTYYFPNVFSPNDDQMNDVAELSIPGYFQIHSISGLIYDRWGNILFSSSSIPFQWKGYAKDQKALPGVYVYDIMVQYHDGGALQEKRVTGDVTIIW